MLSKSEISRFSKLKLKKYRDSEKLFITEGKRLVKEAINSKFKCRTVIITNTFAENEKQYLSSLNLKSVRLEKTGEREFSKLSSTKTPQGILAVFEIPDEIEMKFSDKILVALENISDPGNVGTILRSCAWFGVENVLLGKNCADIYNPKTLRSSMGAVFKLNVYEKIDLIEEINRLKKKDYAALYADVKGIDYRKIKFDEKTLIVFCSEAFGPSPELKNICDESITVPSKGDMESLNVAAAAAVILSRLT